MPKINKTHATPYFEKKFNRLAKNIQKMAARKVLLFEENSYRHSLNTHKLKGHLAGF